MQFLKVGAFLLIITLLPASLFAERSQQIDSLERLLDTELTLRKRSDICLKLSTLYQRKNALKPAEAYNRQAIETARQLNDPHPLGWTIRQKGKLLRRRGKLEQAQVHFDSAMTIATTYNLPELAASTAIDLCAFHIRQTQFDRAEQSIDQGIAVAAANKLKKLHPRTLLMRGRLMRQRGHYEAALQNAYQALELFQAAGMNEYQANTHELIGSIYLKLNYPDRALEALDSSITVYQQSKDSIHVARLLQKKGQAYQAQEDFPQALAAMRASQSLYRTIGVDRSRSTTDPLTFGKLFEAMDELDSAKLYLSRAVEHGVAAKFIRGEVEARTALARIYFSEAQWQQANAQAEAAYALALTIDQFAFRRDAAHILFEVRQQQGRHEEALGYYQSYKQWNDSLVLASNLAQIQQLYRNYEQERKQVSAERDKQQQALQDLKIRQRNIGLLVAVAFVIMLGLITTLLLWRYRAKKQSVRELESAQQALESRNAELEGLLNKRESNVVPAENCIWVKEKNKRWLKLELEDIIYLEAKNNNVDIVTPEKTHREIGVSLSSFSKQVSHPNLIRVHRSFMVNSQHLNMLEDNYLFLTKGQIPIGESYRKKLFERLPFLRTNGQSTMASL